MEETTRTEQETAPVSRSKNKVLEFIQKRKTTIIIAAAVTFVLVLISIFVPIFYTRVQPIWADGVKLGDSQETVCQYLKKPDVTDGNLWIWLRGVRKEEDVGTPDVKHSYVKVFFDEQGKADRIEFNNTAQVPFAEKEVSAVELDTNEFLQGQDMTDLAGLGLTVKYKDGSVVKHFQTQLPVSSETIGEQTAILYGVSVKIKIIETAKKRTYRAQ